jgi:hypothetical protein
MAELHTHKQPFSLILRTHTIRYYISLLRKSHRNPRRRAETSSDQEWESRRCNTMGITHCWCTSKRPLAEYRDKKLHKSARGHTRCYRSTAVVVSTSITGYCIHITRLAFADACDQSRRQLEPQGLPSTCDPLLLLAGVVLVSLTLLY